MATLIWQRDVADVKATFTSWDKCMAKTYCKWPVIAAIIVVALVLISVLICLGRCICCGAECACCCFRCCGGCCGGGGRKGHKKMNSASAPPPLPGGYQPAFPSTPVNSQYRAHNTPAFEKPQFATFESSSKPVNEDALPPMPSWSDATSRKVEEEIVPEKPGDVELHNLEHKAGASDSMLAGAAGTPLRSPGRSPVPQSPYHAESAYSPPSQQYGGFAGRPSQPGLRSQDSFRSGQQNGVVDQYGNQQPGYGNRLNSPAPGAPAYDPIHQYERDSPRLGGQGQEYGRGSPRPGGQNNEFGRNSPRPAGQNNEFGRSSPRPVMGGAANFNNGPSPTQNRGYGPPSLAIGRVNSPLAPNQVYDAPQLAPGRVNSPLATHQAYDAPRVAPGRVNSPMVTHQGYDAPQAIPARVNSPYQPYDAPQAVSLYHHDQNNYTAPEPYHELDTSYTAPKPYAELAANYTAPKPYAELATGYNAPPQAPSELSQGYAPSGSTRFEAPSEYQNNYQQPQELDSGSWPMQPQQQQQHNGHGGRNY
ncbi:uncharacterized protein BDZ99DRAFT_520584 [Mytilinidion resinicola]|uniref:Fibroin-3 related protein n=1 Tax=Mytilinidion resinicola TaxID=574789 RepID=A0A6A6YPN0_9PEZI|nr:uncharacterized protein BDZ99DRAFT_520584 [Mytilinidion resinicola]KAF2810519.1 hypothetical protein BDZ99DRAFT_520584 [Mytilinidion resinicola]